MSEIKAIEKLRRSSHLDDDKWTLETGEVIHVFASRPNDPNAVNWGERWRKIADEIEAEIAERYMLLPVDADGVPIHVGDKVEWLDGNGVYRVCGIGTLVVLRTHESYCFTIDPKCLRIVKPRTLEDVLEEYAHEYYKLVRDGLGSIAKLKMRKAADEIRELLGGDAS